MLRLRPKPPYKCQRSRVPVPSSSLLLSLLTWLTPKYHIAHLLLFSSVLSSKEQKLGKKIQWDSLFVSILCFVCPLARGLMLHSLAPRMVPLLELGSHPSDFGVFMCGKLECASKMDAEKKLFCIFCLDVLTQQRVHEGRAKEADMRSWSICKLFWFCICMNWTQWLPGLQEISLK